jgi:hypothetical protein
MKARVSAWILAATLVACAPVGTAPSRPAPTPLVIASVPTAPTGTVAPAPERDAAPPPSACEAACTHIDACVGRSDPSCRSECLALGSGASYASCATALSCDDIKRSMQMNEGPLGRCYSASARVATSAPIDCDAICAPREAKSKNGYCADIGVAGRSGPVTCREYCAEMGGSWKLLERASFARCMANDPLCYRTLDDCMR